MIYLSPREIMTLRQTIHASLLLLLASMSAAADLPLIPHPERIERHEGHLPLAQVRRILLVPDEPPVRAAAERLAALLATRGPTPTLVTSNPPEDGDLIMERRAGGDESYTLEITPTRARATGDAGLMHAAHTLFQLSFVTEGLPALTLTDRPRFRWRGLMIDVARHFRSAEWLKRVVDQLAIYKLNVLHLHLTDDQGWRLPVRSLPKLTEEAGVRHGGAYTTAEIQDLVAHAAARGVHVVPEIDLPGHVTAALAAYPDLSCRAVKVPVASTWGTFFDVLCPGSESPFVFAEKVITEAAQSFPPPYIHLGGDEVPRDRWKECARCTARVASERLRGPDELQAYFLSRTNQLLSRHGRRPIVWDDDLAHGFPQGTVVQSWHGESVTLQALAAGHDTIASPADRVYLDRAAVATPLDRVLTFDPVPRTATPEQSARVLGAEACLWTEHLRDAPSCERALFPRLLAFAEATWSVTRSNASFPERFSPHRALLVNAGLSVGDGGTRVALLSPRQLAGDWRQMRFDISRLIAGPGIYNVALGPEAPTAVEMLAARISRDGVKQTEILRETSTLRDVSDRIYDLPLKVAQPGGTWTLEIIVRCLGNNAGMASLWLERTPLHYQ